MHIPTGNRFGRVHLHWLFGLIVLIAVTPVFVLYFSRLQTNRAQALAEARSQVHELATRAANVEADIAVKSRHVLETLASATTLPRADHDCGSFLRWVQHLVVGQGTTPWITGLFTTDAKGNYVCGTFNNGKSVNLADREYFKQMMENHQFSKSGILLGRMSKRLIIGATLPIYDSDGKLDMTLTLGADLYQINAIAVEARERFGGRMLVFDKQGHLLADLPQGKRSRRKFENPIVIDKILKADTPTVEIADEQGIRSIYGIQKLAHGQKVAVALSRDSVLAPIERAFRSDLLFLLLVAAGSVTASLILAEFAVLRGVRLLKGAALRLKAGKMGVRVQQPKLVAAELDDLAATYNAMTAEFERLAYLDRLTGLPNRRYLERMLNSHKLLAGNVRQAVLAIDLDSFKPVNDTYGHAMGDRVLTAAARRIAMTVDERGTLTRLGGDEFIAVIQLPPIGDHREFARGIAEEIRNAMDKVFVVDGISLDIGCSVGVAVVPDDATSLAGAIVVADAALYEAKRAGRNRVIENAPLLASEVYGTEDEDHSRWLASYT